MVKSLIQKCNNNNFWCEYRNPKEHNASEEDYIGILQNAVW